MPGAADPGKGQRAGTGLGLAICFLRYVGSRLSPAFLAMAQGEHLAALAAVSRRLPDKEFAARLRGASSVAALCSHLCDPQHSRRRNMRIILRPLPFTPLILPGEVGETICKQAIAPARLAASRRRDAGDMHIW